MVVKILKIKLSQEYFETNYAIGELVAGIGFFFVLLLEQCVTSFCISRHKEPEVTITKEVEVSQIGVDIVKNDFVKEGNGSVELRVDVIAPAHVTWLII